MKLFIFYHDDGCEFAGITVAVQAESEELARMEVKAKKYYTDGPIGKVIHIFDVLPNKNPIIIP